MTQQPIGFGRYVFDPEMGKIRTSLLTSFDADPFWGGMLFARNLYSASARSHVGQLWTSSVGFEPEPARGRYRGLRAQTIS